MSVPPPPDRQDIHSSIDYPMAAQRHKQDGDALNKESRYDNADHLYGFAAECALLGSLCVLHRAGVYPDLKLDDETGAVFDEDLRRNGHIKEVWSHMKGRLRKLKSRRDVLTQFQPFFDHRDGLSDSPYRDWSVNNRYLADGHITRARADAHQKAAATCLAVLAKVEQSYLKRSAAPGAEKKP